MPWQQKEDGGASWYPASHALQQNEALRDRDLRKCPALARIDAKKASISIHLRASIRLRSEEVLYCSWAPLKSLCVPHSSLIRRLGARSISLLVDIQIMSAKACSSIAGRSR